MESAIFSLPTPSVDDLTANWSVVDGLGDGNSETWYVFLSGVPVASVVLPDTGFGNITLTVMGTVNFSGVEAMNGGYQIELVLQNTVPAGGGSVAWLDGGITGLSYTAVPEPSIWSMFMVGFAGLGFARYRRRPAISIHRSPRAVSLCAER